MTHITISQRDWKKNPVQWTWKAEIGHNSWQQQKHPELYSDLLLYPTAALPETPPGPALWALDFGQRACCCMQLSNSNSPLACVIWRCITMRRHLSSKSSSSFAFFRQSRMSGSVDVGSQCFCRIKPEHYRCIDKTSYGKLQTSEINTQPQTWTLAWRSGAVERAGGRQLGSVSEDTKRSIQHGRSTYLPWSSSCRYAPKHNLRLRTRLSATGMNTTHELATCFKPSNATSTILLHGQETVWFEEMDSLNCMHFTKTEPLPGNVWERWNTKQNNMKMIKVLSDVWQRQS